MNLNRKGYLTVEVILASVVAITIAVFLMEITVKLVNVTDDAYVDTELLTDKGLIIKNIKNLIAEDNEVGDNVGIDKVECSNNQCDLTFCNNLKRYLKIENNRLIYGNLDDNSEIYSKNINDKIDNIALSSNVEGFVLEDDGYLLLKVTADNKFSKNNFEADIIVYNNKTC